jgi:multidrug resistance efflux pump
MPKEKDNRRIVQGVQLPEVDLNAKGGGMIQKTYTSGQEDELEAQLSPSQVEYLKAQGAIEGDWTPGREDDDSGPVLADLDRRMEQLSAQRGRIEQAQKRQAEQRKQQAKQREQQAKEAEKTKKEAEAEAEKAQRAAERGHGHHKSEK